MQIVVAIVILSVVILFHELGHFLLAKASHISVLEFSIGMGPKILKWQGKETLYCVKLLPFGGTCMMKGEDEDDTEEGSFHYASVWKRICVVAAGPIFNFILALIFSFMIIAAIGVDVPVVTEVLEGSHAMESGLQPGDRITRYNGQMICNSRELATVVELDGVPEKVTMTVKRDGHKKQIRFDSETHTSWLLGCYLDTEADGLKISGLMEGYSLAEAGAQPGDTIISANGVPIANYEAWQAYLKEHPLDGSVVTLEIEHNGNVTTIEVKPIETTDHTLGFALNFDREKQDVLHLVAYSFGELEYWFHVTVKSLLSLVKGQFSVREVSGPVGVVTTIGDVYESAKPAGLMNLTITMLNMLILISVNLGVMNLLPIPALDGGRLLFLFAEAILGRPVNRELEGRVHMIGFALLMGFMIFVFYNDIVKLLGLV